VASVVTSGATALANVGQGTKYSVKSPEDWTRAVHLRSNSTKFGPQLIGLARGWLEIGHAITRARPRASQNLVVCTPDSSGNKTDEYIVNFVRYTSVGARDADLAAICSKSDVAEEAAEPSRQKGMWPLSTTAAPRSGQYCEFANARHDGSTSGRSE
jgi:hypothetical protein